MSEIIAPSFHSVDLKNGVNALMFRGKQWMADLGAFNEDLRKLEDLLKKLCVPEFEVDLNVQNGVLQLGAPVANLRWESGAIWYRIGEQAATLLSRTDSFLRRKAHNEKWLQRVMEDATAELEMSLEHFEKSTS